MNKDKKESPVQIKTSSKMTKLQYYLLWGGSLGISILFLIMGILQGQPSGVFGAGAYL